MSYRNRKRKGLLLACVYILTRVYVFMYRMLRTSITKLSLSLSVGSFGKSQRTVKESVWSDKRVLMLNCRWKRWSDRKVVLTKWIKNLLYIGANLSRRNQLINVSDRLFIYMYIYIICVFRRMQKFEERKFDKVLFHFSFEYFNVCCRLPFNDIWDTYEICNIPKWTRVFSFSCSFKHPSYRVFVSLDFLA